MSGPRKVRRRAGKAIREGAGRIGEAAPAIAQTTVAAALSWWIAALLLPEPRPSFAPLAAIIALGATRGERGTRAVQVALGVSIGVGVAALVVRWLGSGTLQLGLVTALALSTAVFFTDASAFVVQAGVSGALVVAVGTHTSTALDRFAEAGVGSVLALVFSQFLLPSNPLAPVVSGTRGVLSEVADGLRLTARGLAGEAGDDWPGGARRALGAAARHSTELRDAVFRAQRSVRVSRPRRGHALKLVRYRALQKHVEEAVEAALGLVRVAGTDPASSAGLAPAVGALADIAGVLARDVDAPADRLVEPMHAALDTARSCSRSDHGRPAAALAGLVPEAARALLAVRSLDLDHLEQQPSAT